MSGRGRLRRLRRSELGGLAGDSFHTALWQGAISVADLVQLALVTHALGLGEYGRLALVMAVVMLVGQFFDVRVGAAATTFGVRRLQADPASAAGVFQLTYLVDLATGVVAFVVVAAVAPFVAPSLIGQDGASLVVLYALTLLVSTVDESSISVLRVLGRFRLLAGYTAVLEASRIALVAVGLAVFDDLRGVLLALLCYETLAAVANAVIAARAFRRGVGVPLTRRVPRTMREDRRPMLRMMLHTNVVSYARLAQVQVPTLVLGALTTSFEVGVYKLGVAAAAIVGRLADPAYAAVLPRLTRLLAAGARDRLVTLLRRATLGAAAVMATALAVLVVLREPVLEALGGGPAAVDAETVLVLAAIAQAVNGALFWNVGLLYAADGAAYVSRVAVAAMVLQLALLVPLTDALGADGAALALVIGGLAANAALTWGGVGALRSARPLRAEAA